MKHLYKMLVDLGEAIYQYRKTQEQLRGYY